MTPEVVVLDQNGSCGAIGKGELIRDIATIVKRAVADAVLKEREACANLASKILQCYHEHPSDCRCLGIMPLPAVIPDAIRARSQS